MWGVCSRISGDGLNVYMRQVLEKIQAVYAGTGAEIVEMKRGTGIGL